MADSLLTNISHLPKNIKTLTSAIFFLLNYGNGQSTAVYHWLQEINTSLHSFTHHFHNHIAVTLYKAGKGSMKAF